jgi:hypothetical protein
VGEEIMSLREDFEEFKKIVDIQLSDAQALAIAEVAKEKGKLIFVSPSSVVGCYEIYLYGDFIVQLHSDGELVSIMKNGKIVYLDKRTKFGIKILEFLQEGK